MEKELNPEEGKNKIHFWIAINAIFLIIAFVLVWQVFNLLQKENTDNNKNVQGEQAIVSEKVVNNNGMTRRALDGVYVENGKENFYPVAFMIDNHVDARLSSNLSSANFVYEAEVEGGITRFMAIYSTGEELDRIGPVRSARPYFVDWAHELSSVYGHCGGSPEALVKIVKDGIIDFNEFYNGDLYWRGDDKLAPHNVYISSSNIQDFLNKKQLNKGNFLSWKFKEDLEKESRPNASEIKIDFIGEAFKVGWVYQKEENDYIRYMGGEIHKDDSGEIIRAKNVLIQYIPAKEIDSKLRLEMDVIGEGDADVCFDGKCNKVIWKKNNSAARTRFYLKNDNMINEVKCDSKEDELGCEEVTEVNQGQEIEFNAGTIWVEVVRPEREVTFN